MNPLYDYSITIRDVRIDSLPDEWSLRLHCDKTDYVIPTTTKDYKSGVIHWTNDGKSLFPISRVSSVLVNRMWLLTCIGRGYTNERVEHI